MENHLGTLLIPTLYGAFGFVIAMVCGRVVNVTLIGLILFAVMKALSALHVKIDWHGFDRLSGHIAEAGKGIATLCSGIIMSANVAALSLFVIGAIIGLTRNMSRH
jgi:hypothetical protein